MALRPVDTETFYREVDEELRRDHMRSLWERYGKLVIAGVVLLIALIGLFFWWQHYREEESAKRSETLLGALDDIAANKPTAAKAKLDGLVTEKKAGPRAAALLTKADLAIAARDLKGGAALFRQVADDADLPQPYRDLGLVRATAAEFDTMQPQAVIDRLKGLAVPGNPWLGSAGEMVAISYMKLNKPQQAGRLFAEIAKDKKLPDSIRSRSVQMAGSLGVDAVQQPAGTQEGK
ncbi:MAG: tetratricopeptide repeat protein [Alphaproteobacteria bacterium]|nr:tetratricopeptide repeat protein [Alphaproteobacteria bacterium]